MPVIRFGTILTVVAVAMGLLVAGVLTGSLTLVYLAIGVAVLAALLLMIGVLIWHGDVFGEHPAAERSGAAPAHLGQIAAPAARSGLVGGPPPGREALPPDAARRGGPHERAARHPAPVDQDTRTLHLGTIGPAVRSGRPAPREQDTRTLRPSAPQQDPRTVRPAPAEPAARSGRPAPGEQDTRTLRPSAPPQDPRTLRPSAAVPKASPGPAPAAAAAGTVAAAGSAAAAERHERPQPQDVRSSAPGQGQKAAQSPAAAKEPAASAGAAPGAGLKPAPAERASTAAPAERASTAAPAGRASAAAQAGAHSGPAPAAANGEGARRDPAAEVTVVPGIARYHRSDCILIRFLSAGDLETMALRDAEEAGCIPCKACRPEQELPAE